MKLNAIFNQRRLLLALILATVITFILPYAANAKPVKVTILYSNDVHGHLLPFDDMRQGKDIGGSARNSFLIHQIKTENPNTIALTAGDFISGTPISGFFKGEVDWSVAQKMGYDAYVIGNHEFDYGQDRLREFIKTSKMPVISANIIQSDSTYFAQKPYVIIPRGKLKIAVLGLTTEGTPYETHPKNVIGLKFISATDVAAKWVPILKKQADIVVVLSHLGYQEDINLAKAVNGIDVIVGGHSHTKIDESTMENGTIIVQGFQWGIFLGRLDLVLDNKKIQQHSAKLIAINNTVDDDKQLAAYIDSYNIKIKDFMSKPLGEAKVDLMKPSYGNADSNLACWLTDLFRERVNADVCLQNTGGVRASIPKGTVTFSDIYNVLPFENVLVLMEADGELVQQVFDNLANKQQESSTISGATFTVENGKAVNVMIGNKPIDLQKKYTIAANDFMANGGSGFALLKKAKIIRYDENLRVIVADYLKTHPVIDPVVIKHITKAQ